MSEQIDVNQVVGQMTGLMVQVAPIKMLMNAMMMAMGGGMMAKTEQPRKKYWWAIVYSFGEGVNYSVSPYGPASSAQRATSLITVPLIKGQSIFVTSTDTPSKSSAIDKFEKSFIRPEYRKDVVKQKTVTKTPPTKDMSTRINNVFFKAEDAFWAEVAKAFPEVKHGDFSPEDTLAWEQMAKKAIATWLFWNHPKYEGDEDDEKRRELEDYMRSYQW